MAEYKGKEVKLDDPFRLPQGSDKKFGVYVKNPKSGNVIMVKFGDPNLSIKRDDPERLKNFRARHNCSSKTDKTTPGYWSCKFWEKNKPVSKLLKKGKVSEKWSQEYKDSIDCDNPKGFSQKAHCQGKKKNEEECDCGCGKINEESRKFIKGWVNPRTKKIIAWNTTSPFHSSHILENLSKYGLTMDDLIDHYIDVVLKRNPKYEPSREESLKRFKQLERNERLADRDETIEYPAIKKGWVAFTLEDSAYGKVMALRGITKDIKKSGIMLLEKFKNFKELDSIYISNYKDTKFAEYTGKTKNDDERYSSNSEAMKFLFGRRPKRREPKTEIGRTMAMFREERARDYKGWVNPKTGQTRVIQGYTPYHVQMIVKDPRFFGLTEKEIKEALVKKYEPDIDAEFMADEQIGAFKRGTQDVDTTIELLAMEKGWVRFVEGEYGEISGRKRFNDRELRKILQLIDEETPLTMKPKTTISLQQYRPGRYGNVFVELYGNLEMNEIKNLIKGRRKGDKQTEIGRTMSMFREEKRIAKTRKNQDPDTHSDLYTDENPEGTIHGLGFKDVETAEASVRKIKASDRTHAHKVQAAIAMEQRAKVMKKTAEAAVYRKFIEEMKKKTKEMNEVYKDSGLGDWFGKGGGGGVEKGGWDRYNASGERIGKCGDAPEGAAYSACLSAEKAKQLGKEGRAKFVQRKRDAQKKSGDKAKGGESKKGQKPVMVKTGAKGLDKKNESFMSFRDFISEGENKPNNPALWKKAIAKAKAKFDVYPSAYANAWASKWYKGEGGTWSKK